jgi:hypothetical protein
MKKLMILILFLSVDLFAQNEQINRIEFNGAFTALQSQITTLQSLVSSLIAIQPLPATVRQAKYNQTLTDQQVSAISTTSCAKSFSVKFFCNVDSIEIDTDSSFSNPVVAYPYSSTFTIENHSPSSFPAIYVKRLGSGNGTASYNYTLWGY